ncbi:MAG: hypothetical protein K2L35_08035, partial [Muribaculaceae bacterium]|nr:hypothetical protein [Muribaculaceae bacterium]
TLDTRDAGQLPPLAAALADPARRDVEATRLQESQQRLRDEYAAKQERRNSTAGAAESGAAGMASPQRVITPMPSPAHPGTTDLQIAIRDIEPLINWRAFLHTWRISPSLAEEALRQRHHAGCPCGCDHAAHKDGEASPTPELTEARRLIADARAMLAELNEAGVTIPARVALLPARREGDDIKITSTSGEVVTIPTLRNEAAPQIAMSDFLAQENDWIGLFVVTARPVAEAIEAPEGSYREMLRHSLSDRLVEGATEWMHTYEHATLHGLTSPRGIRPAIGYPSLPDQSLVFLTDRLLHYSDLRVELTSNGALSPSATTTGMIFAAPQARYFDISDLSEAAGADYARRRGISLEELHRLLPRTFVKS